MDAGPAHDPKYWGRGLLIKVKKSGGQYLLIHINKSQKSVRFCCSSSMKISTVRAPLITAVSINSSYFLGLVIIVERL